MGQHHRQPRRIMSTSASSQFPTSLLSGRERQIVELAVEGHTDEQIAQSLEISTSTVNSYWVRIRGKVGPFSRTEIVSKKLRTDFEERVIGLDAELEQMRERLVQSEGRLAAVEGELRAERGNAWTASALHHLPDAVLVAEGAGDVVYANHEAERMFRRVPGALEGLAVCELTSLSEREAKRLQIRTFMEAGTPGGMRMGFDEPCYAHVCPEESFRATISVEGFDGPNGFMAAFTVREILNDLEAVVRSFRKPFAA